MGLSGTSRSPDRGNDQFKSGSKHEKFKVENFQHSIYIAEQKEWRVSVSVNDKLIISRASDVKFKTLINKNYGKEGPCCRLYLLLS